MITGILNVEVGGGWFWDVRVFYELAGLYLNLPVNFSVHLTDTYVHWPIILYTRKRN